MSRPGRDTAAARGGRVRVDELVVARGLAGTRSEALRLILAGRVRLDGGVAAKPGRLVRPGAGLALVADARYVGRGGEKLAEALAAFGVATEGRICLDVGASIGGFTDCLLQNGARRVYAVDVGRDQLHERLRADPRVTVLEGVNARHLTPARFDEPPTLAVIDVAFISLETVLPPVATCLSRDASHPREIVALVKPQFEVGRGRVGKGGVVRNPEAHRATLGRLATRLAAWGLAPAGVIASPLRGVKGNREFFLYLTPDGAPLAPEALGIAVDRAVDGEAALCDGSD